VVFGLDMRFLGRNWQKKNSGNGKGIRMSCFALRAAPVFDRAVARLAFDAGLKVFRLMTCVTECPGTYVTFVDGKGT
jgi:hypothetical protein